MLTSVVLGLQAPPKTYVVFYMILMRIDFCLGLTLQVLINCKLFSLKVIIVSTHEH